MLQILYGFCRLVNGFISVLLPINVAFLSPLRAITLERDPSKKKQRTDIKKYAKNIKSDNFTRSNRDKSNIAIEILEN